MTTPKKKKILNSFLKGDHGRLLEEASSLIKEYNKAEEGTQNLKSSTHRIKKTYLVQESYHDKLKLLAALKKREISDLVNEAFRQFLNQKADINE